MSMINDALKRAQESQSPNPPSGPPPLPPVESKGGHNPAWIILITIIAISGTVVGFLLAHRLIKKAPPAPPAITNTPPPVVVHVVTNLPPPTNPPAPAVIEWPKIQGILYDSSRPMAIVNLKTVGIGDRVGAFKVKAISHDSVTLEQTNGLYKEIKFGK